MSSSNDTEEVRLNQRPTDAREQRAIVLEQQALNGSSSETAPAAPRHALRNTMDSTMSYCASLKGDVLRLRGWSRLLAIGLPSLLLLIGIIILAVVLSADKHTTAEVKRTINGTTTSSGNDVKTTNSAGPVTSDPCADADCTTTEIKTTASTTTPTPEQTMRWLVRGPLVDMEELPSWAAVAERLDDAVEQLKRRGVEGVFLPRLADFSPDALERCRDIGAKMAPVRIIADVNTFVDTTHDWFNKSENFIEDYEDYFVWKLDLPNNWVDSWRFSAKRQKYYLQLHGPGTADLNLANPTVRTAVQGWLSNWTAQCNVTAVRLKDVRRMWLVDAVNKSSSDDLAGDGLKAELEAWKKNLTGAGVTLFTVDTELEALRELSDVVQLRRADFDAKNHFAAGEVKLRALNATAGDALQVVEGNGTWTQIEEAWLLGLLSPFVPIFKWRQLNVTETDGRVKDVWDRALGLRRKLEDKKYQYMLHRFKNEIVFTRVLGEEGYVVVVRSVVVPNHLNVTAMMPGGRERNLHIEIMSNNYRPTGPEKVGNNVSSSDVPTLDRCVIVLSFPIP